MTEGARHLYVHVPFCAHRCGYCDFVTVAHSPELHDRYVAALAAEIGMRRADLADTVDTVYVGGGTPSLLGDSALVALFDAVEPLLARGAEVTLECNPETVTPMRARLFHELGVNRVSLGAQSMQAQLLTTLERRATPGDVRAAVHTLRAAGIDNLSLDLIWGIPGQSEEMLRDDLAAVVALGPDHVSAYELELKPGTRLARTWAQQAARLEAASDAYYDVVIDTLGAAGYEWYETANFAQPGKQSRHNMAYWAQRDHAGVGIGAFGTVRGERRRNTPGMKRYLEAVESGSVPPAELERLDESVQLQERVMLALRLARPLDLSEVEGAISLEATDRLSDIGLLERSPGSIALTRRGRTMLHGVLAELLV